MLSSGIPEDSRGFSKPEIKLKVFLFDVVPF